MSVETGDVERVAITVESKQLSAPRARVLQARALRMLDVLGLTRSEISLAFVGDETIAQLNRKWRRKAKPTDVLSFPLLEGTPTEILARAEGVLLGDVIVSVPTAQRQADERNRSLVDEITTLLAHGVLHLLGFDHPTDDAEREMDAYVRVLEAAATNKQPLSLRLSAPATRQTSRRAKPNKKPGR